MKCAVLFRFLFSTVNSSTSDDFCGRLQKLTALTCLAFFKNFLTTMFELGHVRA